VAATNFAALASATVGRGQELKQADENANFVPALIGICHLTVKPRIDNRPLDCSPVLSRAVAAARTAVIGLSYRLFEGNTEPVRPRRVAVRIPHPEATTA
jgi:hypothetical protein